MAKVYVLLERREVVDRFGGYMGGWHVKSVHKHRPKIKNDVDNPPDIIDYVNDDLSYEQRLVVRTLRD